MKKTTNYGHSVIIEKKLWVSFFLALLLLFLSSSSFAQNRWQASGRVGANFATKDLGVTELNTGVGIEGTFAYRFQPHLLVYTGWGWNHFSSKVPVANIEFEETGYTFGLQFVHPIKKSKLSYVASVGAIYNHIEMENKEGDIIDDSGHGFGWQAEAGLSIQLNKRLHLVPVIRYRSLQRDLLIDGTKRAVELSYVSAGTGIVWNF
ncbi:MAG: opacity protein [Chitinophagaceae bacterium]|nr:MAG: opacity protein [Chitinophagaceae bacterium]